MKAFTVELAYSGRPKQGIIIVRDEIGQGRIAGLEEITWIHNLKPGTFADLTEKGIAVVDDVTTIGTVGISESEPSSSSVMMVAVVKSFYHAEDVEIVTSQSNMNIDGVYGLFNGDTLSVTCTEADGSRKTRLYKNMGDAGLVLVNQPVGVTV